VRILSEPGQIHAACARRAGAVGRSLPRCTPGGAGRSFEKRPGVRVRWVALQLENIGNVVKRYALLQVLLATVTCCCVVSVQSSKSSTGLPLRQSRDSVDIERGKVPSTSSSVCVSVQMRSGAVVQASLGCEVEDAFERDDREQRAAGREGGQAGDVEDKRKAGREGGRAGDAAVKRAARVSSGLRVRVTRSAAARRLHGHDDDALISPTTSIPGRASVRDRINRAKGMTVPVRQAIRLKFYTTRSLKRDETAGYIRLVRATGEGETDTVMRDAEVAELESDRSPMISDTDVNIPVDDFSD
jgi:hypothetical protein